MLQLYKLRVRNQLSKARQVCFLNEIFIKRDFIVVYRCQYILYSAVLIWNLFSTIADYPTYRVEVLGAPDRFISRFPS
jgi:hypothetical protein